jgi:Domain of unknown function (DUF4406)
MDGLRIYVAGPMESAGGNWNMPLFDYVAKKLRERGCEVFSPAEHIREMHGDLETVLKLDKSLRKLARKEALKDEICWIIENAQLVLLLPGWERSPGATAERAAALAIGIEVREVGTILLPTDDNVPSMQGDTLGSIPD